MNMKKSFYFAYGSNINVEQMKVRCPNSKKIGIGELKDYELVCDVVSKKRGGGVFSIKHKKGVTTKGLVYLIDDADLRALDGYEGLGKSYKRVALDVKCCFDKLYGSEKPYIECWVYIGIQNNPSKIELNYLKLVLESAEKEGLDEEYITSIKRNFDVI